MGVKSNKYTENVKLDNRSNDELSGGDKFLDYDKIDNPRREALKNWTWTERRGGGAAAKKSSYK